jgi:hypothetical protein
MNEKRRDRAFAIFLEFLQVDLQAKSVNGTKMSKDNLRALASAAIVAEGVFEGELPSAVRVEGT